MLGKSKKIFNHSGNLGDLLFSLHFVIELMECLHEKPRDYVFNIQTGQPGLYYDFHPYGSVMMTENTALFLKPLLKTLGFKDITISDSVPDDCLNLSDFRQMSLNLGAGDLRSHYYELITMHLPQNFSRNLFEHLQSNTSPYLGDKVLLIHTARYNNCFVNIKDLQNYSDNLMFVGMPCEYESFQKEFFDLEYLPCKNALDLALKMKSACGVIGNQSGLYALAEALKVPRILITAEYNKRYGRVTEGPVNVNPQGGWFDTVRTNNRLMGVVYNMFHKNNTRISNCNSNIDSILDTNIFHSMKHGKYIECGAHNGVLDSISYYFEKYYDWSGYLIEPQHELMALCKQNRASSNIFIEKGLGDTDCLLDMTIPNDNVDNASFQLSADHVNTLKSMGYGKSFKKEQKEVISYQTLVKQYNIQHIDLAIFDVEGYENKILKSLMDSDVLPRVLVVETDWSDVKEMLNIVSPKYNFYKQFSHDTIFILK